MLKLVRFNILHIYLLKRKRSILFTDLRLNLGLFEPNEQSFKILLHGGMTLSTVYRIKYTA